MTANSRVCRTAAVLVLTLGSTISAAAELGALLATVRRVGPKGAGNQAASEAWQELARADAAQLPEILAGLDGAGPLAANWIRTAVDAIVQRELDQGGRLPAEELERFLLDKRHDPRGRRLAYECLARVDPSAPKRLIPTMLDDPSLELRRDAVARMMDRAAKLTEANKNPQALAAYRRAMTAARDPDQIRLLAGRLDKLGEKVDLARHYGFIMRWRVIGPFDNTDEGGYSVAYPPQQTIDPAASHPGKHGPVKWIEHVTKDAHGKVDLNQVLGEEKSVLAYVAADFISQKQQDVEIRTSTSNAVRVWMNGTLVDEHNVNHSGLQMDQYVCRATLRPGKNVLLAKICQNAQTQSWARVWGVQLRVCDENGGAILSADRPE